VRGAIAGDQSPVPAAFSSLVAGLVPSVDELLAAAVISAMLASGRALEEWAAYRARTFTLRFADGNWVWIFALFAENGRTRLISRNRIAAAGAWPARLFGMLVMEPGSLIMERKMLLGIKERAEDLAGAQIGGDAR